MITTTQMTKHPYEVVVMKAAIADLEGLRKHVGTG